MKLTILKECLHNAYPRDKPVINTSQNPLESRWNLRYGNPHLPGASIYERGR
jgi:hypothetical protein